MANIWEYLIKTAHCVPAVDYAYFSSPCCLLNFSSISTQGGLALPAGTNPPARDNCIYVSIVVIAKCLSVKLIIMQAQHALVGS